MKKYKVIVNGTAYEIELEELTGSAPATAAPTAPAAPTPAPAPAPAPVSGEKVCAPIPGTILSINVAAGQSVQEGQVLMVLEAMKMENEIVAPKGGVVASINTTKGAAVESGALLCVIQ